MRLRAMIAVAALCTVLAACGGGKANHAASTTTSKVAPNSTSAPQQSAADKALAQTEVWKLSDFPAGWSAQPATPDTGISSLNGSLDQCLGTSVGFLQQSQASADSPNFSDASNDSASETIVYLPSASEGDSDFTVVLGPKFPQCYGLTINSFIQNEIQHPSNSNNALPPGASVGQASVTPLLFPSMGDHTAAFRVTTPLTYLGQTINMYIDLVAVQRGRAVSMMTFESVMSGFDITLEQSLAAITSGRMGTQANAGTSTA